MTTEVGRNLLGIRIKMPGLVRGRQETRGGVRKAATPGKIRVELIVATTAARLTGTRAEGGPIVARLIETRKGVGM